MKNIFPFLVTASLLFTTVASADHSSDSINFDVTRDMAFIESSVVDGNVRTLYFFDSREICTSIKAEGYKCRDLDSYKGGVMKYNFSMVCKDKSRRPQDCDHAYHPDEFKRH